jgi:micrococcal nuclease
MYEYHCTLDNKKYPQGCVDGDTVDVIVDLGFRVKMNLRIRLSHVDTPERGADDFEKATQILRVFLSDATVADNRLILRTSKQGKYGRWLGELISLDLVHNVNEKMAETWPYTAK